MTHSRTRIKICGLKHPEEARWAATLGVDAIGLVFYHASPRHVGINEASQIVRELPAFVTRVGLFVDADADLVEEAIAETGIELLQFHGNETPAYCSGFDRPYMKALRVQPDSDFPAFISRYQDAAAVLLDAWHPQQAGGTGASFDWNLLAELSFSSPLVLAGGLHAGNVADAIQRVHPYAVDVSSGVEVSPGKKSQEKMTAFVDAVNRIQTRD